MLNQKYLLFKISDYSFSIPIENISKVIDTLQTRTFPLMKETFEGLFIFEDHLIPMLKLSEGLGIITSNVFYSDVEESVIIAKSQNYFFGFRADEVEGIISVTDENLMDVDNHKDVLDYINTEYSKAFFFDGQSNILILDIDKYVSEIIQS